MNMTKLIIFIMSVVFLNSEIFAQSAEFYKEIDYSSSKLFFTYEIYKKPELIPGNL